MFLRQEILREDIENQLCLIADEMEKRIANEREKNYINELTESEFMTFCCICMECISPQTVIEEKWEKLLEHKHFCYALFAVIDKEQDVDTLKTIPRAMYRTAYLSMTELYYYFTADLMIMKQLLNCFADITKPKCVLIRTNGSILLMH